MSEQSARYQRSPRGLVTAMLVLVVLVVGWVVVSSVLRPDEPTTRQRVDYAQVVPQARKAADFDLLAPAGLPAGWHATSVRFTDGPGSHWHLGALTDRQRYVGLEQGDATVADFVAQYVDEAATRGTSEDVGGRRWSTWTDDGGDLALVRRAGRTTTLVVGHDVGRAELASYVGRLR